MPALASTYGYDHFGNQITDTETPLLPTTTSYNAASQTKRVTAPDTSWVEYGYDGLERMIYRTDNTGATVLFFHDGLNHQIALETDPAGAVGTRYLVDSFGVARGKLDIGNSTGRSYYMTDPRANVTQMIGASDQAVKAVFAYDPYGKDKAALSKKLTANWDSRLKFQMAPKDPKTGAYSIGSRLMNPTINRFVGSDSYVASGANLGLQADPLTGNRYLYAGANPAGLIDDGHRCKQITSSWTLGNCEDDSNAFLSGGRDAVKLANEVSGSVATGASFITVACPFPCGAISGPLAGAAGAVNLGTGAVIWVDECWFHKQECIGASAGLALGAVTRRIQTTLQASNVQLQAPELLDEFRFGLNTANSVGQLGIGSATARPKITTVPTARTAPTALFNSEQIRRTVINQGLRHPMVMEAGRQRLKQVRTALGDSTPI